MRYNANDIARWVLFSLFFHRRFHYFHSCCAPLCGANSFDLSSVLMAWQNERKTRNTWVCIYYVSWWKFQAAWKIASQYNAVELILMQHQTLKYCAVCAVCWRSLRCATLHTILTLCIDSLQKGRKEKKRKKNAISILNYCYLFVCRQFTIIFEVCWFCVAKVFSGLSRQDSI